MSYEYRLNIFLKKSKYNLLQFDSEKETRDNEQFYKIFLNQTIDNKPLNGIKSDWVQNYEEGKQQCCKRVYEFLINEPSVCVNSPEKKFILDQRILILILISSNLMFLMILAPFLSYVLFPLLLTILILLTIPWILYRNNRIMKCTGNRVIVRDNKSYETFKFSINYINKEDFLIDISNGKDEIQDTDEYNFLAIAIKKIYLSLIPNQENKDEDPTYIIQPDNGMRIRKDGKGIYSCSIKLVLTDGKELNYFSANVPADSFRETLLPIFKVISKHGVHFFPEKHSKTINMKKFQKYQIIISIHFDRLVSYLFFFFLSKKNKLFYNN
ncbi:hypothetical protein RB653_000829 [Dictyostelium firmibasis]|uniref:Uncharacterized protein n=1 Tax=Dictyostelium firmibasis TaxID=79012 RepID=A0AAN7Z1H3_9MYCE